MPTYLYKLTLVERLQNEQNWTKEDEQIVHDHFHALQRLLDQNQLIMAGRTLTDGPATFGIVTFTADSEKEASAIMNQDPAVDKGIMNAELFPYSVALFNSSYSPSSN